MLYAYIITYKPACLFPIFFKNLYYGSINKKYPGTKVPECNVLFSSALCNHISYHYTALKLKRLRLSRSRLSPHKNKKTPKESKHSLDVFCSCAACSNREYYLFENCGARRAAFKPYFFLSFILGSLVRKPAFLSEGRYSSSSTSRRALEIPCLIAPA